MTDHVSLEPNFTKFCVQTVHYPQGDYTKFSYTDPTLKNYEVTVIADSVPEGSEQTSRNRLTTIVGRFPRPVLAEVNTHRVFSRNSASSRARSVKTTVTDVMENPYIPLFTYNQKGMSGKFMDSEDWKRAEKRWLNCRDRAVYSTLELLMGDLIDDYGSLEETVKNYQQVIDDYYEKVYNAENPNPLALSVHKQTANRPLESYMWHEAIITSSYWDNFIKLRTDLSAAQPEIVAFANLVKKALEVCSPTETWLHLPFVPESDKPVEALPFSDIRDLLMLSATESAQISYKDKSAATKSTATTKLGERLLNMRHLSPFEHSAFSSTAYHNKVEEKGLPTENLSGNLDESWVQLRKVLKG